MVRGFLGCKDIKIFLNRLQIFLFKNGSEKIKNLNLKFHERFAILHSLE